MPRDGSCCVPTAMCRSTPYLAGDLQRSACVTFRAERVHTGFSRVLSPKSLATNCRPAKTDLNPCVDALRQPLSNGAPRTRSCRCSHGGRHILTGCRLWFQSPIVRSRCHTRRTCAPGPGCVSHPLRTWRQARPATAPHAEVSVRSMERPRGLPWAALPAAT